MNKKVLLCCSIALCISIKAMENQSAAIKPAMPVPVEYKGARAAMVDNVTGFFMEIMGKCLANPEAIDMVEIRQAIVQDAFGSLPDRPDQMDITRRQFLGLLYAVEQGYPDEIRKIARNAINRIFSDNNFKALVKVVALDAEQLYQKKSGAIKKAEEQKNIPSEQAQENKVQSDADLLAMLASASSSEDDGTSKKRKREEDGDWVKEKGIKKRRPSEKSLTRNKYVRARMEISPEEKIKRAWQIIHKYKFTSFDKKQCPLGCQDRLYKELRSIGQHMGLKHKDLAEELMPLFHSISEFLEVYYMLMTKSEDKK